MDFIPLRLNSSNLTCSICALAAIILQLVAIECQKLHMVDSSMYFYIRYIDDLFPIWTGTKEQFKDFVTNLNNQHPSIKSSHQISKKSLDFLDTTVYIKNRRLHTTIFTKPMDKQNYLHYRSKHPLSLKINISFGQILRIKRDCSEALEF